MAASFRRLAGGMLHRTFGLHGVIEGLNYERVRPTYGYKIQITHEEIKHEIHQQTLQLLRELLVALCHSGGPRHGTLISSPGNPISSGTRCPSLRSKKRNGRVGVDRMPLMSSGGPVCTRPVMKSLTCTACAPHRFLAVTLEFLPWIQIPDNREGGTVLSPC